MKMLRQLGSLAFVLGLFIVLFGGIPWQVLAVNDPALPKWLILAIFSLLGGIFLVLVTVALEQKSAKPETPPPTDAGDGKILMLNSDTVPGRGIGEVLGVVQGHTVYAIWLGNDLSAIIRLVLGGELHEYTDMMGRARALAVERMEAEAAELGADAVINLRYMTTSVIGSAAELLVYGTAVKLSD